MKNIEICFEVTRRASAVFTVEDEEVVDISEGVLPEYIRDQMMATFCTQPAGEIAMYDQEEDWTATDCETGKVLKDWR